MKFPTLFTGRFRLLAVAVSALALLSACATDAVDAASAGNQQVIESSDPAFVALSGNLPDGVTVASASQKQLNKAVKRTIYAHPEFASSIVAAVTEVSLGKAAMIKKALAAAKAPYVRPYGRAGSPPSRK